MLLIPLAYDQPAMAARLARLGIAEVLPVMRLSSKQIRSCITKLLSDDRYHDAAVKMQSKIRLLRGTERSADVIEESLARYLAGRRQEAPVERSDRNHAPDLTGTKAASFLHG